jgi:hypothetical protein
MLRVPICASSAVLACHCKPAALVFHLTAPRTPQPSSVDVQPRPLSTPLGQIHSALTRASPLPLLQSCGCFERVSTCRFGQRCCMIHVKEATAGSRADFVLFNAPRRSSSVHGVNIVASASGKPPSSPRKYKGRAVKIEYIHRGPFLQIMNLPCRDSPLVSYQRSLHCWFSLQPEDCYGSL